MNKNTLIIIIAGVIALVAGVFFQLPDEAQKKQNTPRIEFSFPDLSGKQRHVSEWQGKILVINFWASWCGPCREEIPEFIKLQNEFRDKGLQFIGIAIDEKQAVKNYLDTIAINYPILMGGDSAIPLSHQLGNFINAVPFTLILDQKGRVMLRKPGEISREEILEEIEPLLSS